MEKIEYHTKEEKAVCNFIKRDREKNRKHYHTKQVTINIDIEEIKLCTRLFVSLNKNTGHVSFGHGIRIRNTAPWIHPSKNKKRRCTNQHAIEVYRKRLSQSALWNYRHRRDTKVSE